MGAPRFSALRESSRRGQLRPAEYEEYTPPQRSWVAMRPDATKSPAILWRAANRVGKTRGQTKKLVHFIRRTGPYAGRRPGPVRVLVISISKDQMVALHEMIWTLLPKDEIDPLTEFTPGYGFRGKPPRVSFVAGPGRGSIITFATYAQGSKRIAGFNFDVVLLDEPPPERMWGEVLGRVAHGSPGEVWISFTSTPDSPDLTYLREKVEKGEVREMVTRLTEASVTLEGGRALLTQKRIDMLAAGWLELERDMRLNGGWEVIVTERVLTNFASSHIRPVTPRVGALLAVGVDQGAGAGKQASALISVDQAEGLAPYIDILEESVADGYTTPEADARAVLAMLERRGLHYDDVDVWVGDRASGVNRFDVRKSNRELLLQLARLLGREPSSMKRIETPRKWGGSVTYGFRLMNAAMGRTDPLGQPHFRVDARCVKFADAARRWRGAPKDVLKDILDAARYPMERVVSPGEWFAHRAIYA